ncbi:hypothetical protein Tco_0966873, partial [Tanacetum coccineum]
KEGYANNTNRVSTVNPSVSAAGQGFDNANDQERIDSSTQDVNTVGPSINTVNENINIGSSNINTTSPIPNDPSMQSLEATGIFSGAYDDEDVGEDDLNNLEITMNIEAMQEELLQFKLQKVWTLIDLAKVIKNDNKVLKRTFGETKQEYEPTIAEEKQDMRNEMKARETLLMALPNKDQLKFHS